MTIIGTCGARPMTGARLSLAAARAIAGTLGFPSKMPGTSYGLPASRCITGAKLARIPGTVCHSCYALRDRMTWTNPQKAFQRRLVGLSDPRWVDAMVRLLSHEHAKPRIRVDLGISVVRLQKAGGSRFRFNEPSFHRWHDSGDLQSVEHLAKICEVARRTPTIRHWLPTQELGMVRGFLASGGSIPSNLLIRVSSLRFDDPRRRSWSFTASVYRDTAPADAYRCPAPQQEHRCMACRACWSTTVAHVAYKAH